ncbi:hypothetical protein C1646_772861 [Rhizophagus diaphanus]|nr:hypothetical protein C1646_772861 [Rhizophagus diaphanus] [Rhizophagus sp. MUCL 43196]
MTDELDQIRLPLLAGILDISSHLLERTEITDMFTVANMKECSDNITTPSCCTIISGNELEKLPLVVPRKKVFKNRDHPKFDRWRFKVEKVGLGSYYGFKVDKNERILLADLTIRCRKQLRVHVRNLNAFGQNSNVVLYERGYGKDAAGIAKDAINYGMYKIDYGGDEI